MSANNWTECPRCKCRHEEAVKRLRDEAANAYGKVSIADWKERDEQPALEAAEYAARDPSFREDWEIGVFGDNFSINYEGGCNVCGLSISFKHQKAVEVEP